MTAIHAAVVPPGDESTDASLWALSSKSEFAILGSRKRRSAAGTETAIHVIRFDGALDLGSPRTVRTITARAAASHRFVLRTSEQHLPAQTQA